MINYLSKTKYQVYCHLTRYFSHKTTKYSKLGFVFLMNDRLKIFRMARIEYQRSNTSLGQNITVL